jgi:hypothetical protein
MGQDRRKENSRYINYCIGHGYLNRDRTEERRIVGPERRLVSMELYDRKRRTRDRTEERRILREHK